MNRRTRSQRQVPNSAVQQSEPVADMDEGGVSDTAIDSTVLRSHLRVYIECE